MTCENSVLPKFTAALPIYKNRENYRGFVHTTFKSTPNKISNNLLSELQILNRIPA